MIYLSPNLRRDFLDDTLKSSYLEYDKLLKDYKKVLKSRNSILKAMNEGKAKKGEIEFWNEKFIQLSKEIYTYRFELVDFLKDLIINVKESFS
jgi:DNA replication and repair protein RecF